MMVAYLWDLCKCFDINKNSPVYKRFSVQKILPKCGGFCFILGKYLHRAEFRFYGFLDAQSVAEEFVAFLREDREDEFIVVFETVREILKRHDCVFDFFAEKGFFEKIVEFHAVELSDDEYVDNVVGCGIAEIENGFRYCHEIKGFSPLEKLSDW